MLTTIYCAPNGGTLYLITGTSQFKFDEILNLQDKMTGVDKSVQQIHMKSKFPELVFSSVRLINLHANLSTQK